MDPALSSALARLLDTDLQFNALLLVVICASYFGSTRAPITLLIAVITVTATILVFGSLGVGETVKLVLELPLGLGSFLAFRLLPQETQTRCLPAFTRYVNFAVYSNIGAMVFVPTGSTARGVASIVSSVALTAWIIQQGYRRNWATLEVHGGQLCFVAVSMPWVLVHSVYRAVLFTLPGFSKKNRLLEVFSLGTMAALARSQTGLSVAANFGLADTLVMPSTLALSCLYPMLGLAQDDSEADVLQGHPTADALLATVSALAATVAFCHVCTPRSCTRQSDGPARSAHDLAHESPAESTADRPLGPVHT